EEAAEDQARATAALHHLAHLEPGLVIRNPDDTSASSPPAPKASLSQTEEPASDETVVPAVSASELAKDFSWMKTDQFVGLHHEGSDAFETFDRRHQARSRAHQRSLGESPYPTHSPTTRPLNALPEIEEPDPSAAMADAFSTELSSASMNAPQISSTRALSSDRKLMMRVAVLVVSVILGVWIGTSASVQKQTLKFARLIFIGRKPGGTLRVESIPPGAKVLLDDEDTGQRTPMTMKHLESEITHNLTLRLTDKIVKTATVTVEANRRRTLRIVFSEAVSSARVETTPKEASVFINGQAADFTPTTLILGADQETTVKVTKPGYIDHAWTFQPIAGKAIKLSHIFEKTDDRKEAEAEQEEAMRKAGIEE
ncbi:MAG: PEGA domain-containing protein, partial [Myxococcota bacterium]